MNQVYTTSFTGYPYAKPLERENQLDLHYSFKDTEVFKPLNLLSVPKFAEKSNLRNLQKTSEYPPRNFNDLLHFNGDFSSERMFSGFTSTEAGVASSNSFTFPDLSSSKIYDHNLFHPNDKRSIKAIDVQSQA